MEGIDRAEPSYRRRPAALTEKYAASPCVLPKPGATLAAEASLAAEAWYEVFVQAKSQRPDTVKDGALPGVSFKTSRWLDAKDMLDSIGFPLAGGGRSAGDIEIKALPHSPRQPLKATRFTRLRSKALDWMAGRLARRRAPALFGSKAEANPTQHGSAPGL